MNVSIGGSNPSRRKSALDKISREVRERPLRAVASRVPRSWRTNLSFGAQTA